MLLTLSLPTKKIMVHFQVVALLLEFAILFFSQSNSWLFLQTKSISLPWWFVSMEMTAFYECDLPKWLQSRHIHVHCDFPTRRLLIQMIPRIGYFAHDRKLFGDNEKITSLTVLKWAASWQNQQNDCAPSKDSDQAGHPPSPQSSATHWRLRRLWSD